jgi:23S rRNA-/tRNA-specific pseudouridylate synthase
MLNRGYAYTTIINSKYHGRTLLSHLASLYPHSPQAWQQNLDNGEVTLNGITATGSESVALGQTLVWDRPPWIEPDPPQHFEVLFNDRHLLAVNKPGGLPTPPRRRLHGKHSPALGAATNPQRKSCPPVRPSHFRHRPLRQNTAGGLSTIRKLEYPQSAKNLPSASSKHCTARCLRNSHTHRPCTAPAHRFCVGR